MKYHTIAIDCDDVIIETTPLVIAYYNETYGTSLRLEDMYTDNLERWGVSSDKEAISRVEAYLETPEYQNLAPLREAVEIIKRLGERYELHMITGRTNTLETATKAMLDNHFPKLFRSLEFTGMFEGSPRSKADVCTQLGADLLIDDHLGHALPVAQCGVDVLLFGNYPWNQTQAQLPPNIRRVQDWQEVAALLL